MNNLFFDKSNDGSNSQKKFNNFKTGNSDELSNNSKVFGLTRKTIRSKHEFDDIIRRFREQCDIREKEGKFWNSKEQYTGLLTMIQNGIVIDNIPYRDEIINNLFNFFSKYGISKEEIVSKVNELEFFVSDINIGYGGKLVQTCGRIGIDISYADFSEDGNFIGFKPELKDFLMHTLTHEILHKLSEKSSDNKMVFRYQDALSEGYTDMLAHIISGKESIRSDLYEFPEKMCELFVEMIGMGKVLEDYLYHCEDFPNLQSLFLKCGCKEFSIFRNIFDKIIERSDSDKKTGKIGCLALEEKDVCLSFIRDNILFPYCCKNSDRAVQILNKFNSLFSVYGYEFSIDDVKFSSKYL